MDSLGIEVAGCTLEKVKDITPGKINENLAEETPLFRNDLPRGSKAHFLAVTIVNEPENTEQSEDSIHADQKQKHRTKESEKRFQGLKNIFQNRTSFLR